MPSSSPHLPLQPQPPHRSIVNPFHFPAPPPPPAVMVDTGKELTGSLFASKRKASSWSGSGTDSGSSSAKQPKFHRIHKEYRAPAAPKSASSAAVATAPNATPRKGGGGGGTADSSRSPLVAGGASPLSLSARRVQSRLIPGRSYYGGIYYTPRATMTLDRALTAMYKEIVASTSAASAVAAAVGGSGETMTSPGGGNARSATQGKAVLLPGQATPSAAIRGAAAAGGSKALSWAATPQAAPSSDVQPPSFTPNATCRLMLDQPMTGNNALLPTDTTMTSLTGAAAALPSSRGAARASSVTFDVGAFL